MTVVDAIRLGDLAGLRQALQDDPSSATDTDLHGVPALLLAIYHHNADAIDLLLRAGAPVDAFAASAMGKLEELEKAIDANPAIVGANSGDGWTMLHYAAYFGQLNAAVLLLRRGADVHANSHNPSLNQPLHSAAAGGHPKLVQLLLKAGAAVNATDSAGYTALHASAQNGDLESIRALLAHKAHAGWAAADGKTPIDVAREHRHAEAAQLLLG